MWLGLTIVRSVLMAARLVAFTWHIWMLWQLRFGPKRVRRRGEGRRRYKQQSRRRQQIYDRVWLASLIWDC